MMRHFVRLSSMSLRCCKIAIRKNITDKGFASGIDFQPIERVYVYQSTKVIRHLHTKAIHTESYFVVRRQFEHDFFEFCITYFSK